MLFGLAGQPEVQVGDQAPDFELHDQNGVLIRLSQQYENSPVVLFFYPKDNTPGCKMEVCSFRDAYQQFLELGAVVIGVSSDHIASHLAFAKKHQLPFSLLADVEGSVRRLYGVPNTLGVLPGRVTYIINQEGLVQERIVSQFDPLQHIRKSLKSLHELHAEARSVNATTLLIDGVPVSSQLPDAYPGLS